MNEITRFEVARSPIELGSPFRIELQCTMDGAGTAAFSVTGPCTISPTSQPLEAGFNHLDFQAKIQRSPKDTQPVVIVVTVSSTRGASRNSRRKRKVVP